MDNSLYSVRFYTGDLDLDSTKAHSHDENDSSVCRPLQIIYSLV